MEEPTVVAVFGASSAPAGSPAYDLGVSCGRLLAERGFAVATGGYAGLMEAVSAGASAAGGHVIGVTAPTVFRGRHGANRHITEEVQAETITQRIHELIDRSDAAIALPGSLGTITELLVAWNVAFVAQFGDTRSYPVVAVGETWQRLIAELAAVLDTDAAFVTCVNDVPAAVTAVAGLLERRRAAEEPPDREFRT